ncbi:MULTISPECIES: glycosyltransferase family 1 protein [Microbacterium]|uniref:glycosyltransferase family 4 protein n=1 Tax=Microbacterium TaxID=33882 RepID=UPI0027862D63|nr:MULTISPECIES: glycosyltransferase family 1 protein [Microbacterium]MDQ1075610.1 glycosyltransferase involved in cell wall biosynthesis [Microbacterium sp. SORGH_AS_0969]MDQ1115849.1 glycosyltransferase involved in cell wall biosynthesis [Microbacterium testaceum]
MAHIVLDARGYFSTTGRYIRKLVDGLARRDDDSNRYTLILPADRLDEWSAPSARFSAVGTQVRFFSLAEQTSLAREIRALQPDLVHFCLQQQPVLLGIPRVTTFHDMTLLKIRNAKKNAAISLVRRVAGALIFAIAAHRGRANLVVSRYSGEDLRRFTGVRRDRIVLTYPAADHIEETPEPVELPFERFVLFVGNQVPYKNLERLFDAVERLREERPGLGLVVAGRIDDDGERILGRRPELAERAHFAGYVSEGQLRWLYEHASVFAFPSFFEGFGLPGLEAMRHGCPVASSSATCLPEVYGDAAVYFDPTDADAMADTLRRVIDDPVQRAALIERGHRRADGYSWRRMTDETLGVYRRALEGTRRRQRPVAADSGVAPGRG